MTPPRMLRQILNFGRTPLEIHNAETLQTEGVSNLNLPPLFALWRHKEHMRIESNANANANADSDTIEVSNASNAVLIASTKLPQIHSQSSQQPTIWKFMLVQHPIEAIHHGTCESSYDRWLGNTAPTVIIRRDSIHPESNGKLHITTITYTGYMIRCHQTPMLIPIFNLTNKCLILPTRFITIDSPGNNAWRFPLRYGDRIMAPTYNRRMDLQRAALAMAEATARNLIENYGTGTGAGPAYEAPSPTIPIAYPIGGTPQRQQSPQRQQPQQPQQSLPQHIVNAYIDDIVRKGDECPIEMTSFTRENTALTPCGHAVLRSAAIRWMLNANSCPVCRIACSQEQLQIWRA